EILPITSSPTRVSSGDSNPARGSGGCLIHSHYQPATVGTEDCVRL
ncbi:hypothetical protein, partial [Sideroxydans sp. CL21]